MGQDVALNVNGATRTVNVEPGTPLLYVMRNDLELNAPSFGCGLSQCGACTVLVDGKPTRSCVFPTNAAAGKRVTTLEGLGGEDKAIANAIANATGARLRDLPFTPQRVKAGVAALQLAAPGAA